MELILKGLFGLFGFVGIAWLLSENRLQVAGRKQAKTIFCGLAFQIIFAVLLLKLFEFTEIFILLSNAVRALQAATTAARDLCCRDVAAQLRVPTLIVNGRYEKSFQPDRAFALATIPGLEVVDLDAGHSVNIEAAAGFDAAVIDFASRHP